MKSETSKVFPLDLSLYFKTSIAVNDVNISKTRKLLYIESSLWKTMLSKTYITRLYSYRYFHFMWSVNSILTRYFRNYQSNCFDLFLDILVLSLFIFFFWSVNFNLSWYFRNNQMVCFDQSIELAFSRHAPWCIYTSIHGCCCLCLPMIYYKCPLDSVF